MQCSAVQCSAVQCSAVQCPLQSVESYCRQLLLHSVLTSEDLDLGERATVFIDLFANIRVSNRVELCFLLALFEIPSIRPQ